jgi:hypothetical protein
MEQLQQAQDMPAATAGEEAEALARAVLSLTDADVVQLSDAETMDRECPAADEAGDFVESVVG